MTRLAVAISVAIAFGGMVSYWAYSLIMDISQYLSSL